MYFPLKGFIRPGPAMMTTGRLLIVLLAFFLVLAPLSPAAAEKAQFTHGPYLQDVTPNTAVICWQTNVSASGVVAYGAGPDYGLNAPRDQASKDHCVQVEGLKPYTSYHYQVQVDGVGSSADAAFKTLAGPDQSSISFVAWGDHRSNQDIHHQLAEMVKGTAPDFVIDVGDLVDSGSSPASWDIFFSAEQDLMAGTSVFPTLGNHEGNSPLYFSQFFLPGNKNWYSFDSGPAHFVALDVVSSSYQPGSDQYRWLEQDLRTTTRPWKIVYMHYPPYSFGPEGGSVDAIKQHLSPLFEKYGVQLVFSGHTHYYQRNAVNGVNYVVTGGGGAPLYPVGRGAPTVFAEATYEFVKIAINGDVLTSTGVRLDGTEFDSFTLQQKMSEVSLAAPATVTANSTAMPAPSASAAAIASQPTVTTTPTAKPSPTAPGVGVSTNPQIEATPVGSKEPEPTPTTAAPVSQSQTAPTVAAGTGPATSPQAEKALVESTAQPTDDTSGNLQSRKNHEPLPLFTLILLASGGTVLAIIVVSRKAAKGRLGRLN